MERFCRELRYLVDGDSFASASREKLVDTMITFAIHDPANEAL